MASASSVSSAISAAGLTSSYGAPTSSYGAATLTYSSANSVGFASLAHVPLHHSRITIWAF